MIRGYIYFISLMKLTTRLRVIFRVFSVILFQGGNVFNRPHGITSRITYSSIIIREDASRLVCFLSRPWKVTEFKVSVEVNVLQIMPL